MNQLEKGFKAVVAVIIGSIITGAILSTTSESGLIPSFLVFLFTIAGILGTVATLSSYQTAGTIFTVGWILGAWLLKDAMSPFDFGVFFWAPVVMLVIRAIVYFKGE